MMLRVPSAPLRIESLFWKKGILRVAGVDEAGRGCLAGPVVAAAVIWKDGIADQGIRDSKCLSARQREQLLPHIEAEADAFAVGISSVEEIDQLNILNASLLAMVRAVEALALPPQYCLIDGNRAPEALKIPSRTIVHGDRRSRAIAAASIVAKVTRDRMMDRLDEDWPQYGWISNKGYATQGHIEALARHGPCDLHRRSFRLHGPSIPWT